MKDRLPCLLSFALAIVLTLSALPALAQEGGGERFESAPLGVAFDLPAGWQVVTGDNRLLAGSPADLTAVEEGSLPAGLTVRMTFGTFNELGIVDATQLPDLLNRLVASNTATPAHNPIQWGNASGYESLVVLGSEGLTTRVALLAVTGGRVAVIRGLAPTPVWDSGGAAQFDALAASLAFSLPARDEGYMDTLVSNDGGVLWHFLSGQPESGRVVAAGGITYDSFNVMYMAAGPGGILALEMSSGNPISYLGPWYNGDFVDIAIGSDTKLYLANPNAESDQPIMVVDRAGNWTRAWGSFGDGDGQFAPDMPQTIAVARGGDVWTVSEGHASGIRSRLYRFDAFGNLLATIDLGAINPDLRGVRIDNNLETGALYLVGEAGNLNVIDANGEALVVNLAAEVLNGTTPVDIAIAPNDNLILAFPAPGLDGFGFAELSPAGRLLDVFGSPFDAVAGGPFRPGEYLRPGGLVMGPDGTGYWTESNPATGFIQVQRFTFTGDGLLPLGSETAQDTASTTGSDAPDPAMGGGSLAYGQSMRGSLNNRYPVHRWTFEGQAGDHVIIAMSDASQSGLLDPSLVLLDVQGTKIAANDDVGAVRPEALAERDALIDFFLPADSVYTIEAGRFGGRGEYILTLDRGS